MKPMRLVFRTRYVAMAVVLVALAAAGLTLGFHHSGGGPSAQSSVTSWTTLPMPGTESSLTTLVDPARCRSGSVSMTVTLRDGPDWVCLRSGAILHATFDTSAGGGMGIPGAWSGTPMVADSAVLALSSSSAHGRLLDTQFTASGPGTTTVSAYYDNECSEDVTPCTVPPLGTIELTVQVIAQP